jgi:glutamate racemase
MDKVAHASHPIGVFDSGIGGLSILKALREHLPHEQFVYYADTAHNPYGEKSEAFVQERTLAVARELVERHAIKALVVACNTATAAAIHLLREAYPSLPIVGVEPSLKPAALATRTGRVLVLATRGTLQSAKFAQLKAYVEQERAKAGRVLTLTCVPCDGLAERIELLSADANGRHLTPDLIAFCADFMTANSRFGSKNDEVDTLVLGCTHYPLIGNVFRSLVGNEVTILDNAAPVAKRTAQLLRDSHALTVHESGQGALLWQSSASVDALQRAARYWLGDVKSSVVTV